MKHANSKKKQYRIGEFEQDTRQDLDDPTEVSRKDNAQRLQIEQLINLY